jgi:pimeloyl-ACP methyl ester carboxylesterase
MPSICKKQLIPEEHKFEFSVDESRFEACYLRADRKQSPVCVIVAGSGPSDVDGCIGQNPFLQKLSFLLYTRGISSLRFGKKAIAGEYPIASYEDEYLLPLRALDRASKHLLESHNAKVLVGHSLGGHLAPWLAGHLPSIVGIVAINAHASSLPSIVDWQLHTYHNNDIDRFIWSHQTTLRGSQRLQEYFDRAASFSPEKELSSIGLPFLCILSGQDAQLPKEEYQRWRNIVSEVPRQRKLIVFPDLDHVLSVVRGPDLLGIYRDRPLSKEPIIAMKRWISRL